MSVDKEIEKRKALFKEVMEKAWKIMEAKTRDYSNAKTGKEALRASELIGISPIKAIMVRVCDKISRLNNLLDQDAHVNESFDDSIIDTINYMVLILKLYREDQTKKSNVPLYCENKTEPCNDTTIVHTIEHKRNESNT